MRTAHWRWRWLNVGLLGSALHLAGPGATAQTPPEAPPAPAAADRPTHGRPFFLPAAERERLRTLVRTADWAKAEYARVQALAAGGDGFWAAFLFALDGDAQYLPAVRQKLAAQYGPTAYFVAAAQKRLADPAFFTAGQVGIPDVYYDLDTSGLLAYDWAAAGLTPDERRTFTDGMLAIARYRMRCMDRWNQTPNLVFKPTFMVALTGMVTQDAECLAWGFRRRPGSPIGGYFEVLNTMLWDGGPWHEAPIYPAAHTGLWVMSMMSWYRGLADGQDWFRAKTPRGGSPAGLMDYYLASTYPGERTGEGDARRFRVATYGDGATGPSGSDLFLVNPAPAKGDLLLHDALIAAYNASGSDARYAPFVARVPGYRPTLWGQPPLPDAPAFPPAPSSVWPTYGLAMLRSDESPGYWTNDRAMAVFMLMSQGYGHDHRDKFSLTFFGAGRLLYPDCNPVQYENPDVGWTRNGVCHNTLLVDEQDPRNAPPTRIAHDFTPEVKYLAVAATGVFEGVTQTRALFLTSEYLLDIFHAESDVPHTYDYLLHSFGKAQLTRTEDRDPPATLMPRSWMLKEVRVSEMDEGTWSIPLTFGEGSTASVSWRMAGVPGTLVGTGVDAHGLTMLAARRQGWRATTFVAVHEPCTKDDPPRRRTITVLGQSATAILVRVAGDGFTDYAAAAFGADRDNPLHVLTGPGDRRRVAFRGYGYLRVHGGRAVARGGWSALRLPPAAVSLTLNGQPATLRPGKEELVVGELPITGDPAVVAPPSSLLSVALFPVTLRLAATDERTVRIALTNPRQDPVTGRVEFGAAPAGVTVTPDRVDFGTLAPKAQHEATVTVKAAVPPSTATTVHEFSAHAPGRVELPAGGGRATLLYRVVHGAAGAETVTGWQALPIYLGPTLVPEYRHPERNVFVVHGPRYTAELLMRNGVCVGLRDDDDAVRLADRPLFTLGDGKTTLLAADTQHAFTWPTEAPAHLVAHAQDRVRYHLDFGDDRLTLRLDPDWTQFDPAWVTVPGQWVSPGGAPTWARLVAIGADGKEADAPPAAQLTLAAAELRFPGAKWHLAMAFDPPQPVALNGLEMKFPLGSLKGDRFSVGFCRPGALAAWRGK